jgi:LysR family transcriptional regulator for bpeEF and oprC
MDRLLANKLFCRVVELGSFTRAGREARLPQSSVSRAIAALEETLATRLLERTTRRVVPTLEGRAYYAQIEEAVRTLEHAEAAARSGFAEVAGHVRIAVPGAMGRKLLVPRIVAALLESPDLRVDVSTSDQPVDFLAGGFDFAVRVGEPANNRFVARKLAHSPQWLVASPRYLAIRGTPTAAAELRDHHFVLRGVVPRKLVQLDVVARMCTDEIETAYVTVLAGIGLSILPRWLVAGAVHEGRLVRVLPALDTGSVPVIATYPSAKRLRKPARRVLDRLSTAIRDALSE